MKNWMRYLILALIAGLIVIIRFTPLGEQLNLQQLARQRDTLLQIVADRAIISAIVFIAIYIAVVALSIPGPRCFPSSADFYSGRL